MTRDDITNAKGRDLNVLVAVNVFELHRETHPSLGEYWTGGADDDWVPLYPYGSQMEFSWKVHEKMMESLLHSKRNRYFDELQLLVSEETTGQKKEWKVAWPDVLCFLKPSHICKAALITVMEI